MTPEQSNTRELVEAGNRLAECAEQHWDAAYLERAIARWQRAVAVVSQSNSGIVHGPEAPTLPAVQRYAIAHHERDRAGEQAARAQRTMEYEEADARRALIRAGVPAQQRIAVRLLGGAIVTLFWDEAGLVVID